MRSSALPLATIALLLLTTTPALRAAGEPAAPQPIPSQAAPAAAAAEAFISALLQALPTLPDHTALLAWVRSRPDVTEGFQKNLAALYEKAWRDDPELGPGANPILDSQDPPESYKTASARLTSATRAEVLLQGEGPAPAPLRLILLLQDGRWKIHASGLVLE